MNKTLIVLRFLPALVIVATGSTALAESPKTETGFVSLFDGKTLSGWKKADENPDSWKVRDGMLMCDGARCHLFYTGDAAPFQDFHFKADVMTTKGSNAGIYFHTR